MMEGSALFLLYFKVNPIVLFDPHLETFISKGVTTLRGPTFPGYPGPRPRDPSPLLGALKTMFIPPSPSRPCGWGWVGGGALPRGPSTGPRVWIARIDAAAARASWLGTPGQCLGCGPHKRSSCRRGRSDARGWGGRRLSERLGSDSDRGGRSGVRR